VVVLTPITANVTSSFDSTQTALNLTAPASTHLSSHVWFSQRTHTNA
jgi:hypothetical protein